MTKTRRNPFIVLVSILIVILALTGCSDSSNFNVVYDVGYGISIEPSLYDEGMSLPVPEKEDYTFDGWYLDSEYNHLFKVEDYVNYNSKSDITVYAKWIINQYTITFNTNGGSSVSSISQDYDTLVTAPNNPTKLGYTFSGWSQPVPIKMPAEDVTLIAEWSINQYTIAFNSNGGSPVTAITQDYATTVSKPTDPTKVEYTFAGWYINSSLTTAYTFTTMPAQNITLYAKWVPLAYNINYELADGLNHLSNPSSYTIETNTIILSAPTKEGYTFEGWYSDSNFTNYVSEITIGSIGNLTLYAKWIPNSSLETFVWLDADGTILHESLEDSFDLPEDTEKWDYTEWIETGDFERTATREPQYSYFIGNVFQVIVYNLGMQPIATGSGFVFNEYGWFITNNHVMEDGYFAEAIFDIQDIGKGESFTKLDINLASYKHSDKDIFIGKIDNYSKVGNSHYKQFEFNTSFEPGDLTYSVGYPNSSIRLQINEGYIESDLSSIYDKVYSGITYIGSTSFIAPGSSGGILINNNLEVLGMTTIGITDNNDNFILGGAIEAFNYFNLIQNTNNSSLVNYSLFLHPEEKIFIGYYKDAMDDEGDGSVRTEFNDCVRYTYTWEDEGINGDGYAYTFVEIFIIDSDGWMSYESNYYWDNGGRREIEFYGYYSNTEGIKNFTYNFKYTWSSSSWYTLSSTNINYSTNIALTLNNYTTTKASSITISESNIEYAKEQFNWIYEWLTEDMARFK